MSTLLTVDEFIADGYMSESGGKTQPAIQVAIDIAEGDISEALGYPVDDTDGSPVFIATQFTEEWPTQWPPREHQLLRPRIITIDTVTALHAAGCDCEWTEIEECAFIYDARHSIVKWEACTATAGCYRSCRCPRRIRYLYTAGFTAAQVVPATPTGRRLRLAIALQARSILDLQNFYTEGNVAISTYSSLGYSEKREFIRTARGRKMGLSLLSQAAADMLGPLVVKTSIMIRSQ